MKYEIKHYLKGHRNEYYALWVWLHPTDRNPRIHTSTSRGYISRKLAHYKNVAKRLDIAPSL